MKLEGVDLNLLVSLGYLLELKNVSQAAAQSGITQPTMSYRLTQLRKVFDDKLLVRAGREMRLTPLAEGLQPRVAAALAASRDVFSMPGELAEKDRRLSYRIATTDYEGIVFIERLATWFEAHGHPVDLRVVWPGWSTLERLTRGHYDVLLIPELGPNLPLPEDTQRRMSELSCDVLFTDDWVGVTHRDAEIASGPVSPRSFADADHVLLTILEHERNVVDDLLESMGLSRRVALTVPTYLQAHRAATELGMVAILPRTFAERMDHPDAVLLDAPFPAPPLPVKLWWHPHLDENPRHQRLREGLRAVVAEMAR